MSNDLEVYGGSDIQPYSPDSPLAPSPADNWGVEPDYAYERQHHQSTAPVRLFGEVLPAGATAEHVQQAVGQISGVFLSDFSILGHNQSHIHAAIAWLQSAATRPPQQEAKRNDFPLFQYEGDPVAIAFSNAMARAGASATFVSDALWWVTELEKRIGNYGTGHDQPTAMDGSNSGDPLDSLNNDQYEAVIAANDRAKANAETILRRKWGSAYEQNIALAQRFLDNLSQVERDHFSQYTTGFIHSLNTVECLEGLFNLAVGNIPTHGGAVATEIATLENYIRTDRRRWNNDLQAQARLRALYDIRDRGR